MVAVNLERMTLKQIEGLETRIAKAKIQAREMTKTELKAKIDRLLNGSEFTVHEIYGFSAKKYQAGKSVAKYANPNDISQTWTGRGRRPDWLIAQLKKGASLEDFAI